MDINLKVLTLNCWGIPYVSRNRVQRMRAIADQLLSGDYDIVCFQEVWSAKDYELIKNQILNILPYSHYFYSGVLGSGICLFTKFPIQDVIFHKWSLNGYAHKIHHGDWFGGKGVGLCRLKVNDANINVYVAHLHAEYNPQHDEYSAHRVLQAFDMAQFIRMTERGADAVILGGDLNTSPNDLAYRIICGVAGLADACSTINNDIGTNECANNSYTPQRVARKFPQGKRIDHILYLGSQNYKVEVISCQQPFPKRIPNKNFSYSDHEAVVAELKITKGFYQTIECDVRTEIKEALSICEASLKNVRRQRIWYVIANIILIVPLMYSMGIDSSFTTLGYLIGLNILRLVITAVLCYSIFMSTIWSSVEQNALKAGNLAMEVHLLQLNNNINNKNSKPEDS
ncbi:putative neutral sphingomyelinase [Chelonus insularis]|uniref:putative neutral sphingomyelinase n=1 Tax=Chelonus insularis TaxID=460826 RepID=UPI0015897495|nr:putative neutral sphingomyelinase [Chelonus insularis]